MPPNHVLFTFLPPIHVHFTFLPPNHKKSLPPPLLARYSTPRNGSPPSAFKNPPHANAKLGYRSTHTLPPKMDTLPHACPISTSHLTSTNYPMSMANLLTTPLNNNTSQPSPRLFTNGQHTTDSPHQKTPSSITSRNTSTHIGPLTSPPSNNNTSSLAA